MKQMKILSVLFLSMLVGININAQEKEAAQVTFIYPIGTAGTRSVDYTNNFSFNIIGGLNGGVNGFELGSVANINKGNVSGCQISGVCNVASGDSKGFILSGVANISKNQSKGVEISGVANVSGMHNGLQLSTINFVKDDLTGAQIGVVNYAKKGKGFQFGVVNVCGSDDGILPIGIISVVKNGYYAFEVSSNEVFLTSFSYKMGTEKFHTIFRTGIGEHNKKSVFSTGFGFGSILPIKDNHKLNLELICDDIHYDWKWEDDSQNMLNQFNVNYHYQVTKHLAIKAGPSFKTFVSNQKDNGEFIDVIKMPYTLFEHTGEKYKVAGWIGVNVGIVLSL
jgi:hypothetical protein